MYFKDQEVRSITFIFTDKNNYRYTYVFYYADINGKNLEFKITSEDLKEIKYWINVIK